MHDIVTIRIGQRSTALLKAAMSFRLFHPCFLSG